MQIDLKVAVVSAVVALAIALAGFSTWATYQQGVEIQELQQQVERHEDLTEKLSLIADLLDQRLEDVEGN